MTDALEQDLRAVLAERAATLPAADAEQWLRRVRDPRPTRRLARQTRLWSIAGAVTGVAATATVLAVTLLVIGPFSSTTPAAFAGWTPIPVAATAASAARAERICSRGSGARPTPGSVLLSESRGPYTAVVWNAGDVYGCIVGRNKMLGAGMLAGSPGPVWIPKNEVTIPGAGGIDNEVIPRKLQEVFNDKSLSRAQRQRAMLRVIDRWRNDAEYGPGAVIEEFGLVGPGVTGVTIVLTDGTDVRATVHRDWYYAWWPGRQPARGAMPSGLEVTTASGSRSVPWSILTESACPSANPAHQGSCPSVIYPISA